MKRLLMNGLVVFGALLVALAASEIALRVLFPPALVTGHMTEFDDELAWRLVPGEYDVKRTETFVAHEITVNSRGMRNREIDLVPAPGARRVLVLGDSFTFGMLAGDDDLFTTVAEDRLRASSGDWEIVNIGVPGWGTAQQLLRARQLRVEGIDADAWLLVICTNDILDNLRVAYDTREELATTPGFEVTEEGELVQVHEPERRFSPTDRRVRANRPRHRLYLTRFVRLRIMTLLETKPALLRFAQRFGVDVPLPRAPSIVRGWYDDETLASGWPLTAALVRAVRDEAGACGVPFLVAMVPSPFQIYESYDMLLRHAFPGDVEVRAFLDDPFRAQRLVGELCAQERIPFVDCTETFLAERNGPNLYSPNDHHFSPRGHRVAGEAIAEMLAREFGRREKARPAGGAG